MLWVGYRICKSALKYRLCCANQSNRLLQAINLARDFGPRLMSYAVGYGHEVWSAGGYYFWIPMVAPFLGCLFGGVLYDVFIFTGERHGCIWLLSSAELTSNAGPSPINTPWFGMKELIRPRRAVEERLRQQRKEGIV